MPHLVVEKTQDALNEQKKAINGSKVLVLGVAYKKDIDDVRESPALDVIELLQEKGAEVSYHDPVLPVGAASASTRSSRWPFDKLDSYDCVVIVTDHTSGRLQAGGAKAKLVIDTRNAMKNVKAPTRAPRSSRCRSELVDSRRVRRP